MASYDEHTIREMVRRVVQRAVGKTLPAAPAHDRALVTEQDVQRAQPGAEFQIPPGALVTPLARQVAVERGVTLLAGPTPTSPAPAPALARSAGTVSTVALGADHGGYPLKEALKHYLEDLGYAVLDCGTDSAKSVDYPDYAYAAAQLVAQGRAWRAILVDGAGIGSCMAANKVPGIRAAMCYDDATAVNSREHNDANVLTLGAGMIGPELGRKIVKTWLETPAGGGRHARRVEKIMSIEQRFLRQT